MVDLKWWQKAVFYQIYPRSFADSNGDGIGDLPGIIQKLDYLKDLGIDAIWLSPHYPSPQIDCGYDISDYFSVAPEYGSMDDFKRFLDGVHQRGMRLILDLVLNHTSHLHSWFQESRSSLDNPYRDWYIWRDGRAGGPPNNWNSHFGGSAWEFDPITGQYYYHYFFKEQPDLNWRNPLVKNAMFDTVRHWLDLGVDGFRLDAIGTVFEDPRLPDHDSEVSEAELYRSIRAAKNPDEQTILSQAHKRMFRYQTNQPEVHGLMRELRAVLDEYDDRVLVGETDDISYYGDGKNELHMVFNFPLMRTERLTADWVRSNQELRLTAIPPAAWPCNTLGNHDVARVYSRFGNGRHDDQLARISLALMLTLRGTPFLYNGEEIGMADTYLNDLGQIRDTLSLWIYRLEKDLLGASPEEALAYAIKYGRDKCRTPFQWKNAPNAGFSPDAVQTWLPVNSNYAYGVNAEDQEKDPSSLLNYYRFLLALRKRTPALISGSYIALDGTDDYLAFLRSEPVSGQTCLVMFCLDENPHVVQDPVWKSVKFGSSRPAVRILYSSHREPGIVMELEDIKLAPYEIFLAELVQVL